MTRTVLLLFAAVLCQGCYSYRPTAVGDLKTDKYYIMRLNNEMNVRGLFYESSADSVAFRVRHRLMKYAKNDISQIKRKKISALKSIGILTTFTVATVLSVTTNNVIYPGTIYGPPSTGDQN